MASDALQPGELASLLEDTSRTFALAIPLLAEPLATDVGLAYLLFRIADTLEDAPLWPRDARLAALSSFAEWVTGAPNDAWRANVRASPPCDDAGTRRLLERAPAVLADASRRDPDGVIAAHVVRTTRGMAEFVARQDPSGGLSLRDPGDLRAYCYVVAGIVGELCTALFVLREPALLDANDALAEDAAAFGEGLQLVNIIKDAPSDAREGRFYVPRDLGRDEVIALARRDLERASAYVDTLARAGASRGVRMFCELPVRLAEATLDRLSEGGAKLTRAEVQAITARVVSA